MKYIKRNEFVTVIPGFSESESDIGNDTPSISSDVLNISNRKTDILGVLGVSIYYGIRDNRLPQATVCLRLIKTSFKSKFFKAVNENI